MQNSLQSFVIELLKEKLSPFLYYHNVGHTLYVQDKAAEISRYENCSENDMALLDVAALWHDTGYINTYLRHEEESCTLAKQHLPSFDYSAADIDIICGMIMATRMPQSPHNKLEEIIADADLAYLGTPAAAIQADELFRELQHRNPILTKRQWLKTQINFLQNHHYFTSYCKKNSASSKAIYLAELLKESEWPVPGNK